MRYRNQINNILILCILVFGCEPTVDSDGFTYLGKCNYNGEFRVDGLYIGEFPYQSEYFPIAYYWEDGTTISMSVSKDKINKLGSFECFPLNKLTYDNIASWGAYIIDGNEIKKQQFYNRNGTYKVSNSTISIISKTELKVITSIGDIIYYKFHPCTNKPDSANKTWNY